MKRASYREGVEWIALNDDVEERDQERLTGYISVALLADIFCVEREKVARDVARKRSQIFIQGDDE